MKIYLPVSLIAILFTVTGCFRDPLVVEEDHVLPEKAVIVHVDNFDQYLANSSIAVIEFFSEKCAVCASLTWVIDSMSSVFGDTIFIGANNTDDDTLYRKCSVPTIPTYVFYHNGEEKMRRTFITNDPLAFDTLVEILQQTIEGISDTGDTSTPKEYALPKKAITVRVDNFDQYISDSKVALIEFFSEKDSVCSSLTWVIDSMSSLFGDTIFIGANNTDDDTLYRKCSVPTVPTYVFYYNGEEKMRRSFITNDSLAFDTLVEILQQTIEGISDTGDTSTPTDTIPPDYLTLTQSTFDSLVLRNGTSAMVFFWYSGGAPCIYMDSIIRLFAPKFENRAVVAKIEAWDASSLTQRYNIQFVPQYLFFKDSVYMEDLRRTGIQPGDTLIAILERMISQ